MLLSHLTHRRQRRESDCLVACAEMVLNYLGLAMDYTRIAKILRAGADFTPFTNLHYLEQLGLSIMLDEKGDAALFETHIALGLPIIVGVQTLDLGTLGQSRH